MTSDQNSASEKLVADSNQGFTRDEMSAAAAVENEALQQATINHLNHRVIVLRATVTRLLAERDDLRAEVRMLREREG